MPEHPTDVPRCHVAFSFLSPHEALAVRVSDGISGKQVPAQSSMFDAIEAFLART